MLWLQHVACSTQYMSLRWCWPGPRLPGRFLKPLPCFHIPRQVFHLWQSLFRCRENKYIPHRIKPVTLHAHTCNLWIFEVSCWTLAELMTRLSTSLRVLFFPTFRSWSSQQSLELDIFFQKWINNLFFSVCLAQFYSAHYLFLPFPLPLHFQEHIQQILTYAGPAAVHSCKLKMTQFKHSWVKTNKYLIHWLIL